MLETKIKRYPRRNFIASDIQDCDRYLCHSVLDYEKRPMQDYNLQALFDAGNQEERNIIRDLIDMGFNVVHQQTPFQILNKDGDIICTGKVDGKIIYEGVVYPFEIKLMGINMFNGIKTIDDLNKKPYQRKYLKQLMMYLYGNNHEQGFFIISNGYGQWKMLPMDIDYGVCESILQRLERSWVHVKAKTYADKIEYNNQLCDKCPFAFVCMPSVKNDGAKIIDNEELEHTLDRREELKPMVDEYEELDGLVKDTFKGVPEAYVGKRWQIVSTCRKQNRVDTKALPEDIRKQYSVESEVWTTKIFNLESKI